MNTSKKKWLTGVGKFAVSIAIVIIFWYFLCPPYLYPGLADKNFNRLTVENGLCHNSVYSIIQDRQGFIRIATQDGLARYDGGRFATLYNDPLDDNSLSDNNFGKLLEDRNGILWLGTWGGGLDRYDPKTGNFTHYKHDPTDQDTIAGNFISVLCEDSKGQIWIGTSNNGFDRFDRETGKFVHYKHAPGNPNSLSNNQIRGICQDKRGTLWISTYGGGVNRFNSRTGIFTRYKSVPENPATISHNFVRTICTDREGNLWLGTRGGGINKIDPGTGKVTRFSHDPDNPDSLGSPNVNHIFADSWGYLWIGTYNRGLDRFDPLTGKFEHFRHHEKDVSSLASNRVETIYEDRSGVLWIGTRGGGVSILDLKPARFKQWRYKYRDPAGVTSYNAYAIIQDKAGNTWIGTDGGGIDKVVRSGNNDKPVLVNYRPDPTVFGHLDHNRTRSLLEDSSGVLWVGTYAGLKILDRGTGKFSRVKVKMESGKREYLDNSIINTLREDRDGAVWVGTFNGLFRLTGKNNGYNARHYFVNPSSSSQVDQNYISAIYEDSAGKLWVGTNNGLNEMVKKGEAVSFNHFLHHPENLRSLSDNLVFVIHEDRSGRFWLGTVEGLSLMDREKGTFSRYFKKDGLSNNSVRGITEDDGGNLWISTSSGLSKFDPVKKSFRNYDIHDGLLSNDFNSRAYYKSNTGEMFFGGSRGVISFFPAKATDNPHIPPVVLTTFKIQGLDTVIDPAIVGDEPIELSFKNNSFSFEFAALEYTNPGKNSYAYRLEGFDKEWKQNGNRRFAGYTNIPAGDYTLRVIGSNSDGVWNKGGAALKIKIISPFWQTAWFRLLFFSFALGLIYMFYRLRTDRVRRRQRRLEELVAQRTRQLKVANRQAEQQREAAESANRYKSEFLARMSHEIRTPINSVIGFAEMLMDTELNEEQSDYSQTIARSGEVLLNLINDILDFSKIEAGKLTFENIDFDLEVMAFDICHLILPQIGDRQIEVICSIGDEVPAYVKSDPGRLRQVLGNLTVNAVKFTNEGEIQLSINIEEETDDELLIHARVRDTGIGIPKDKQAVIFDDFLQADGTTTRKYGGTGLGLAICKQIAQLMKGSLWVESEPGKGSTFHFTARMQKSRKKMPKKPPLQSLSGKKVLIADDNIINLKISANNLESMGLCPVALNHSKDVMPAIISALEQEAPIDICILDIQMPGISGYELAEQIRAYPDARVSGLPLLAFSSSTGKNAHLFLESGFNAYLPKPISRYKLKKMMERLLGLEAVEAGPAVNKGELLTRFSLAEEEKHSACILLAEDNPINRKLAKMMLTKAGYRLETANNGREAVDMFMAKPGKFNLILMDVHMPEMDGLQAVKEIREKGFNVPIIAVTADAMKEDREKCLEAGMNDYITKPIKREIVFQIVKKWGRQSL